MNPPGLAVGRVVHYHPSSETDDEQVVEHKVLGGRVAQIEGETVTIACDRPLSSHRKKGRGWSYSMAYVVEGAPYDENGKPGTWRYPPRV